MLPRGATASPLCSRRSQIRRLLLAPVLLAAGLLSAPLAAQTPCAKLAVDGSGKPGTTLTFALTGADAMAPALLLVGTTAGDFSIKLGPFGTLDLGITPPFVPLPLRMTDANGDATLKLDVPKGNIPLTPLVAQGLSMKITFPKFAIKFCTSNVAKFSIGE